MRSGTKKKFKKQGTGPLCSVPSDYLQTHGVGDDVGPRPTPRQGDSRNLNRRPGHCHARASFRLTPPVRFALRASAHRAKGRASQIFALSRAIPPQRAELAVRILRPASPPANLRPPAPRYLGLRPNPKPRASCLARSPLLLEMLLRKRGRILRHLIGFLIS